MLAARLQIERRELVRLSPRWRADAGAIFLYNAGKALGPAKTRAFIDFITEAFKRARRASRSPAACADIKLADAARGHRRCCRAAPLP
jgi:hypothetical protein